MTYYYHGIAMRLTMAVFVVLLSSTSFADVTVYTDAQAFQDALAANGLSSRTLDFELEVAGTTYSSPSTVGDVTFLNFGTPSLLTTDDFATTSGANYLGVDSTNFANQFIGGYNFDMQFAEGNAVGMFVITGETPGLSLFDNDIQVVVPGLGTAALDVDDLQATIGGTDNVFFIGLIDTMQTFTSAQVRYDASAVNAISFNIDDIVISPTVLLGDVNLDGVVNLLDVQPFVVLISNNLFQVEADINQDGLVNLLDVAPFIQILNST